MRPDARVAICAERGVEMVVGLLAAILKSGAAYLPLDPDYPADRLAFMLADSAPSAFCSRNPRSVSGFRSTTCLVASPRSAGWD